MGWGGGWGGETRKSTLRMISGAVESWHSRDNNNDDRAKKLMEEWYARWIVNDIGWWFWSKNVLEIGNWFSHRLGGMEVSGTIIHVCLKLDVVVENFHEEGNEYIWWYGLNYTVYRNRWVVGIAVSRLYTQCVEGLKTKIDNWKRYIWVSTKILQIRLTGTKKMVSKRNTICKL